MLTLLLHPKEIRACVRDGVFSAAEADAICNGRPFVFVRGSGDRLKANWCFPLPLMVRAQKPITLGPSR